MNQDHPCFLCAKPLWQHDKDRHCPGEPTMWGMRYRTEVYRPAARTIDAATGREGWMVR